MHVTLFALKRGGSYSLHVAIALSVIKRGNKNQLVCETADGRGEAMENKRKRMTELAMIAPAECHEISRCNTIIYC